MTVAGIDFSSRFVDVVLLDEDTDAAEWFRVTLGGQDAFERARAVRPAILNTFHSSFWDDIVAIGIEDPRGYRAGSLYRVQGAILTCLPPRTLVQPWIPSSWRKTVGLPGNASKGLIAHTVINWREAPSVREENGRMVYTEAEPWPQDACDAYCIALATRSLLHRSEAA